MTRLPVPAFPVGVPAGLAPEWGRGVVAGLALAATDAVGTVGHGRNSVGETTLGRVGTSAETVWHAETAIISNSIDAASHFKTSYA